MKREVEFTIKGKFEMPDAEAYPDTETWCDAVQIEIDDLYVESVSGIEITEQVFDYEHADWMDEPITIKSEVE